MSDIKLSEVYQAFCNDEQDYTNHIVTDNMLVCFGCGCEYDHILIKDTYEYGRARVDLIEKASGYIRKDKKISRNDKCSCGSGKKYKNCCIKK